MPPRTTPSDLIRRLIGVLCHRNQTSGYKTQPKTSAAEPLLLQALVCADLLQCPWRFPEILANPEVTCWERRFTSGTFTDYYDTEQTHILPAGTPRLDPKSLAFVCDELRVEFCS